MPASHTPRCFGKVSDKVSDKERSAKRTPTFTRSRCPNSKASGLRASIPASKALRPSAVSATIPCSPSNRSNRIHRGRCLPAYLPGSSRLSRRLVPPKPQGEGGSFKAKAEVNRTGKFYSQLTWHPHARWCGEGELKAPSYPITRFLPAGLRDHAPLSVAVVACRLGGTTQSFLQPSGTILQTPASRRSHGNLH